MPYPLTKNRIDNIRKEIAEALPPRDEYLVTTSEFDEVKQRLERENRPRLRKRGDSGDSSTLRRLG